jgi:acetyl esterase/lipase
VKLILALIFFAVAAEAAPRQTLTYATPVGHALQLDLYPPDAASPKAPLVIWIHGGCWAFGGPRTEFFVRDLTQEGFAVASIGYRLSTTARFPAQLDDCRDALHYLRRHARELHLDPRAIHLAGASAGAHLAALLALEEGRANVRAVLLLYPPTDLTAYAGQKLRFGYIPLLLGGSIADKRALAREASPINHIRRDAPAFYILHGARDIVVPVAHSENFHRKLQAARVESHLTVFPGKPHGFGLGKARLREVAAFFRGRR